MKKNWYSGCLKLCHFQNALKTMLECIRNRSCYSSQLGKERNEWILTDDTGSVGVPALDTVDISICLLRVEADAVSNANSFLLRHLNSHE